MAIDLKEFRNQTIFGHTTGGRLCFFTIGDNGEIAATRDPTPEELKELQELLANYPIAPPNTKRE
jgi:hypothetical protein